MAGELRYNANGSIVIAPSGKLVHNCYCAVRLTMDLGGCDCFLSGGGGNFGITNWTPTSNPIDIPLFSSDASYYYYHDTGIPVGTYLRSFYDDADCEIFNSSSEVTVFAYVIVNRVTGGPSDDCKVECVFLYETITPYNVWVPSGGQLPAAMGTTFTGQALCPAFMGFQGALLSDPCDVIALGDGWLALTDGAGGSPGVTVDWAN